MKEFGFNLMAVFIYIFDNTSVILEANDMKSFLGQHNFAI